MDRIEESKLAPRQRDLPGAAGKPRRLHAVAALVVLLVAAAGSYYAWTESRSVPPSSRQTTAAVQHGDLEDTVTATGVLQPRDYVDVGTQVSGQLKKLHVKTGDTVKQGQLLAEIDPTVYRARVDANRAQLRTQQAQLADRQAQLALAEQQLRRQQNLMRENATTADALETAQAAMKSAQAQIGVLVAQIEQTRSTLRGDEASLDYTRIYAPMSGTVVSENARQGQTLNANQQAPIVVRIADLSTMTVQSQVSEADVSRLRLGQDVYFTTLGSEGKRWRGKLRQINPTPEVVNNVVLYNALFDVDNADGALMTQMTAQVFFVVAQANDALIVPVTALRPARGEGAAKSAPRKGPDAKGGSARSVGAGTDPRARFAHRDAGVRVVQPDGTAVDRHVRVGIVTRVSAQIVSGLEAGEQVVTGQVPPAAASASRPNNNAPRVPRL